MRKYYLVLISVLFCSALLAFFYAPRNSENFSVSFFDVGQGDSEFIQSKSGYQMLIDGGPSDKVLELLAKEMPIGDKEINLVVLTHPHADHLVGLISVLKNYKVDRILSTDAVNSSPEYLEWLSIIKSQSIPFDLSKDVSEIDLGDGARAKVLFPKISFKDQKIKDLNETSVVIWLSYREVSFLFTGDKALDTDYGLKTDFLKVPHHGSKTGLDLDLLKKLAPKVAIILAGKDNQYGLPSAESLKKLQLVGAEIRRTDQEGTIKVGVGEDGKTKIE